MSHQSAARPATPRLIVTTDVAPQAWRNGLGLTRELLTWPAPAASSGADQWQLRLSVADIGADAPFSAFPGVRRWFVVLRGAGVTLRLGDAAEPLRQTRADAPLAFDGALPVHCRLIDGPTRDLNLMLRGVHGALLPVQPGTDWSPPPSAVAGTDALPCGLFTAVPGRCAVDGGAPLALPELALLWFDDAPARLSFTTDHPVDDAPPGSLAGTPADTVEDAARGAAAGPAGWWIAVQPPSLNSPMAPQARP
ncbi:MAG: hypothetical protein RLZZ584_2454 [Pseudomonadota bacterium]